MRGEKKTIYEWLLVVEGGGSFPYDMLRYDSCFPFEQIDSNTLERNERRRVVLVRRGVNEGTGTPRRWESFGWKVIHATKDAYEARQLAHGEDAVTNTAIIAAMRGRDGIRLLFDVRVERQPKETVKNREPGWNVIDRATIVATADTEEEASRVVSDFERMADRVRGTKR